MSDLNNPNNFDKYGNPTRTGTIPGALPGTAPGSAYEPVQSTGRAPYILLGLLVLVGIVGGALYFNGTPNAARRDLAAAPPAVSDTVRTPASPAMPQTRPQTGPATTTPAPMTTPAPAGSATDKQ